MIWELMQEWQKCRTAMLPAIDATCGTHNEDNVLAGLIGGNLKLWVNGSSGVVTDISQFPRMKCLNVFLAGGKLEELIELKPAIIRFAYAQGCQRITTVGRPGWQSIMDAPSSMGQLLYMDL